MTETRIDRELAQERKERAAEIVTRRLILWITTLVIAIAVLMLGIGENLWPQWLVFYRLQIIAFLALFTIGSLLISPLLIEYTKDPRPLSGPGKRPGF